MTLQPGLATELELIGNDARAKAALLRADRLSNAECFALANRCLTVGHGLRAAALEIAVENVDDETGTGLSERRDG